MEIQLSESLKERYTKLRSKTAELFSPTTQDLVDKALGFADAHMEGKTRYNGSPMLDHDAETAYIVMTEIGLGRNSTIASILHDTVRIYSQQKSQEELASLLEEIRNEFSEEVVGISTGLAEISELKLNMIREQAGAFRDMIVAYSADPRVILIKLADRLDVMRNIGQFPESKRLKKSWESMNLYAQIAHKLGLYNIKSELEDLALSQLEIADYNHIKNKLQNSEKERLEFIDKFTQPIKAGLDKAGIKYHIKSRTKSIYSIWNKMRKQKVPFEGVYDIFAIRVIIEECPPELEKTQCWITYSIVSDIYTPNTERMRDWITIPKSNGYESLHTTVSAGEGKWVEIQIRTQRMDDVAELGIAAHWRYKGVNQGAKTSEEWLKRLRELMAETKEDIAERFDAKPASDEIFVFTPNGDIRKLPEGATVLDFAFDIHSNLGCTCSGGRVNGKAVPIREQLKNGDIVEILTQKGQNPKADWVNFVVTSKAKTKIKSFLREEQAKNAREGREELERKLSNWKFPKSIDEAVGYLCKFYKQKTGTALYELIAAGKLDLLVIKDVLSKWISGEADELRRQREAELEAIKRKEMNAPSAKHSSDALIIDESINNIVYKLAKCCNPIKGDDVFGFVTINAGITIHRSDCPNALRMQERYPYRVMPAKWREHAEGAFRVTIAIQAQDSAGLITKITDVVSKDMKLNIRSINLSSRADKTGTGTISVEVPSASVVDTLIYAIMRIKGIQKAYRVKN